MKIAVLSSFTTSLFWFRIDMMRSFLDAGCEVIAVGDGPESEWAARFQELGIRYRQIPVQRNGTNPLHDLKTLLALYRLLKEAREMGAQAALYGHTHRADCHREEDGLWVVNPGTCGCYGGSVALLEVEDGQILKCRILESDWFTW